MRTRKGARLGCVMQPSNILKEEDAMPTSGRISLFATIENLVDLVINAASFVMAFVLSVLFASPGELTLDSPYTLISLFLTVIVQSFVYMAFNLYRPIPFIKTYGIVWNLIRVNVGFFAVVTLIAAAITRESEKSFVIIWVLISFIISTAILVFKKNLIITVARFIRKGRYNLRRVIIVGDNTATAQDFVRQVAAHPECGMMVVGFVGDKIDEAVVGCEKLGAFKDLSRVLDSVHPDDAVFAIDSYDKKRLIKLVNMCDDRFVKVYFLPVIYGFFKVASQIESIGQLPVINIHHTPLDNTANAFIKRLVDIVGSLLLIILTSPVMLFAAIGVALSSPGPIIFTQERVGKMGRTFKMLKFRSMRVNVGSDSEWSKGDDPRKTKFGSFIRMTAIDELPQLFNVLIGDMSLVGPRPEIPYHVAHFREEIPLYMIKHYVKPGMTGLAQVRGLRGDTSIEERIQADIEYIENWTLVLDILILLKTPFKAFNKAEAHTAPKMDEPPQSAQAHDSTDAEALTEDNSQEPNVEPIPVVSESDAPARKKIIYAASTMSHINSFHLAYIDALREEGYEVKIMARGDGADFNIPFEKKLLSAANTACRHEIKRIIEKERPDYIFLNTSLAAFHIRMALPKKGRPKVVNMAHGYLFGENDGFLRHLMFTLAERHLASRTDSIITMNEYDRRAAERMHLARGEVYFCRGLGAEVKPQTVSPEKLRRENSAEESFVLAFVGELSTRKNQEFLIEAMTEIVERIPNAVLWLIGDGIEKQRLQDLAERLGVDSSVVFLGRRDNPCDYIRAANLYVSASEIEGMPFNVIEAMGCGKPVLASRIKGHTDLIEEGKSGFLYRPDDIKGFVSSVVGIYDGSLRLDSSDIVERYNLYSREAVFDDTLDVIKRSLLE